MFSETTITKAGAVPYLLSLHKFVVCSTTEDGKYGFPKGNIEKISTKTPERLELLNKWKHRFSFPVSCQISAWYSQYKSGTLPKPRPYETSMICAFRETIEELGLDIMLPHKRFELFTPLIPNKQKDLEIIIQDQDEETKQVSNVEFFVLPVNHQYFLPSYSHTETNGTQRYIRTCTASELSKIIKSSQRIVLDKSLELLRRYYPQEFPSKIAI